MAVRAFVAVQLDRGSHEQAARLLARLPAQAGAPRARWEPPGNLHLTLRYLGDVSEAVAAEVGAAVRGSLGAWEAPRLRLVGLGAFPSLASARVLFAEVDDGGRLGAMVQALEGDLRRLGFEPEQRAYVPHLTLARCRQPTDLRPWLASLGPLPAIEARGEAVSLFRSVPSPSGPIYEVIEPVALAPT